MMETVATTATGVMAIIAVAAFVWIALEHFTQAMLIIMSVALAGVMLVIAHEVGLEITGKTEDLQEPPCEKQGAVYQHLKDAPMDRQFVYAAVGCTLPEPTRRDILSKLEQAKRNKR